MTIAPHPDLSQTLKDLAEAREEHVLGCTCFSGSVSHPYRAPISLPLGVQGPLYENRKKLLFRC